MKRVVLAAVSGAVLLGVVAPVTSAQAVPSKLTPVQRAYLSAVKQTADTIGTAPSKDLLDLGYATCKAFKAHVRPGTIVKQLMDAGISAHDTGVVIGASVATLCPKYDPVFQKYLNS